MVKLLLIVAAALSAFVTGAASGLSPVMASTQVSAASSSVSIVSMQDGDLPLRKWDYKRYCRSQDYERVDAQGSGAYFLRCVGRGNSMDITITDVCVWKYGSSYISRLRTMDGRPYKRWGCIPDNYAGAISREDMQRQCRQQGGYLTIGGNRYPAYSWSCGNGEGLNMRALCERLYARYGRETIDRINDLYNEDSWECYYIDR